MVIPSQTWLKNTENNSYQLLSSKFVLWRVQQALVIIWHFTKNLHLDGASLKMMPVDIETRQNSNQYVI
jgi:uncharacterized membrane protein